MAPNTEETIHLKSEEWARCKRTMWLRWFVANHAKLFSRVVSEQLHGNNGKLSHLDLQIAAAHRELDRRCSGQILVDEAQ